jgi:hypothetical protein
MGGLRARDVVGIGALVRPAETGVSIFVLQCPSPCRRILGQQVVPAGGVVGEHIAIRYCRDCKREWAFTYNQAGLVGLPAMVRDKGGRNGGK